ncbi:MAG: alpha/beta hydrolase [Herpetosiphonaceae bacterium]|nr:alpha/beta hydrolase [Herpetosiphonaceae bacterium]
MPKVLANGINLHYLQVGEGPDVVMLHGLTGNLAVWHLGAIPALRGSYRTTSYDLRGHGRSDMPPSGYTTLDMAEDLRSLLDALGIERTHLVGHSLGSDVALHFAFLYPERVDRIVAIEAGLAALVEVRKSEDWAGWSEWAKGIENYGGVQVPREKWHDVGYMLRASLNVPIIFGMARGLPRKGDQVLKLIDTTTLVQDYEDTAGLSLDALAQVTNPVLLLYGSKSNYLGSFDVLRHVLPNCTTGLIEGGEHFAPLQEPQQLIEYIVPFLQGSPPVPPAKAGDSEAPLELAGE